MQTRNKKRLTWLTALLAICLITGTVYAAISETLTIEGTVSLGDKVDCQIVDPLTGDPGTLTYFKTGNSQDDTWGQMVIAADGKTAVVTGEIKTPNDSIDIIYKVKNFGTRNSNVTVGTPAFTDVTNLDTTETTTSNLITIKNVFGPGPKFNQDFTGGIIAGGGITDTVKLEIKWVGGIDNNATGEFEFEIDLDCVLASPADTPNFYSFGP